MRKQVNPEILLKNLIHTSLTTLGYLVAKEGYLNPIVYEIAKCLDAYGIESVYITKVLTMNEGKKK